MAGVSDYIAYQDDMAANGHPSQYWPRSTWSNFVSASTTVTNRRNRCFGPRYRMIVNLNSHAVANLSMLLVGMQLSCNFVNVNTKLVNVYRSMAANTKLLGGRHHRAGPVSWYLFSVRRDRVTSYANN